jgi:hypothetical protein
MSIAVSLQLGPVARSSSSLEQLFVSGQSLQQTYRDSPKLWRVPSPGVECGPVGCPLQAFGLNSNQYTISVAPLIVWMVHLPLVPQSVTSNMDSRELLHKNIFEPVLILISPVHTSPYPSIGTFIP